MKFGILNKWTLLLAFCIQLFGLSAFSATTTTALITVTNVPAVGDSFTIYPNGASYSYAFTTSSPAGFHYITRGTNAAATATNIYSKLTNDWAGKLLVRYSAAAAISIQTFANGSLGAAISTNWGTLALSTNAPENNTTQIISNLTAVSITLGGATRTNWADTSGFVTTNDARYLAALTNAAAFDAAGAAAQAKSDIASSNYVNAATWGATNTALQTQLTPAALQAASVFDATMLYRVTGAGASYVNGTYRRSGNDWIYLGTYLTTNSTPAGQWVFFGESGVMYTNQTSTPLGPWGSTSPSYDPPPTVTGLLEIQTTNLAGTIVASYVTGTLTNSLYASNIVSGGQLALGILATNSGAAGFLTETGDKRKYSLDASGLTNLNAANLASGTLPNARLGATVVTNVAQTTNSAGVASIANNVLSIGTNVPASSSGGLTNGQNAVTLGSTTFTNGVTMGRTNEGQNGLTWMTVQSSNSPSTFNFTMAATPYSATNPVDNVCYWGWNVAPGGGLGVAGEAALYYGIERDWYGTFETYMDVAPVSNSWYRPEFWSIDRTNGYCQKLERLDEWQLLSGSGTHNSQIWLVNSNGFNYYAPSRFGTAGTSTNNWVCFYGYSGSQQVTISNGLVGVGDFAAPGICGGTVNGAPGVFVSDYTKTNATSLQVRDIIVASSTGVRQMLISGTQLYPNSTLTINVTNAAQSGVTINGDKTTSAQPAVVYRTNTTFVGEVGVATANDGILTGDKAGDLDIWGYRATSINFAANGSTINTRFYATSNWFGGNQYVGGSVITTILLATNAIALTSKASGPTFVQMGIATNTGFFWSSNSTPPTLYWSYFDGSSNRVDVAK